MCIEKNRTQESIEISCKCINCGTEHTCVVKLADYNEYNTNKNGRKVQEIFSYLTPATRELFFISQICGECWDRIFSED